MGISKYIRMTFVDDIKNSLFYMIVLIFSIVIIFNIFNLALNEELISSKSSEYISASELGFVIMIVSVLFMIFANAYYMQEKYKEYAIISVSGRAIGDICKIMLIRSTIVTIVSVFIGCFIGAIISSSVVNVISELLGIEANPKAISENAVVTTALLMITELEAVFLVNTGNMYRSNINSLINRKKKVSVPKAGKIKIHPAIYIAIYFLPVIVGIIPISRIDKVLLIKLTSVVGIFGIQGLIRYVIPGWIEKYRNKELVIDRYKLIYLSNLYVSIQKSIALMLVLVLSIIVSVTVGAGYEIGSLINSMSLFCYTLIVLIMSFTVVYKFLIEAKSRKSNFAQLKLLGYMKSEIRKIVFKEVLAYYFIIICLGLPYDVMVAISSVMAGLMSIPIAAMMVLIYIGIFSLTGVISYLSYSRIVESN